jgi:MFS family permease
MATAVKPNVSGMVLVLLLTAAVMLNYMDRGTLAVAAPLMKQELGLSATGFGIAVSAFFWVYAPIQLLIGWLCDRVCVYRLFAASLALWAISTALMGLVGGVVTLVALRVLLGLGESIAFPGSSKMIARHVPDARRGIANASVASAIALGPALGTLLGGVLMVSFGWRAMFVALGLVTLLWLVPWWIVVRPLTREGFVVVRQTPFPVSRLLRTRALWTMSVGHFLSNYGFYILLAWLPLYLVKSRGYSIEIMTLLTTATYVSQAASALLWGWLSDRWVASGASEATVRKTILALGQVGAGAAILGILSSAGDLSLAVSLVLFGSGVAAISSNVFAVAQIFAGPRASGSWLGVQNCIGNFSGIVGPIVTGMLIDRTGTYDAAFMLAAAITAGGGLWWWLAVPRMVPLALE